MRLAVLFGTAIAATAFIGGYSQTQAVQLQDGTVYFVQPPRLVEAVTTYNIEAILFRSPMAGDKSMV